LKKTIRGCRKKGHLRRLKEFSRTREKKKRGEKGLDPNTKIACVQRRAGGT